MIPDGSHLSCSHRVDKTEGEAFAGFVACNDQRNALYFSWRGTVSKKEWQADGNVRVCACVCAGGWDGKVPGYVCF
jgi:hypothetical protein